MSAGSDVSQEIKELNETSAVDVFSELTCRCTLRKRRVFDGVTSSRRAINSRSKFSFNLRV